MQARPRGPGASRNGRPEVVGKHVALLKEAIPGLSRSGVLIAGLEADRRSTTWGPMIREAETSAKALGLSLQIVTVPRVEDFDTAFSAFRTRRVN